MNWLMARLREPSTWRGLVWLLTAFGVTLSPEAWEHITAAGMALAGLIGVLTREEPTTVEIQLPPIELIGRSLAGGADGDSHPPAGRLRQPVPSPPETEPAKPDAGWNG